MKPYLKVILSGAVILGTIWAVGYQWYQQITPLPLTNTSLMFHEQPISIFLPEGNLSNQTFFIQQTLALPSDEFLALIQVNDENDQWVQSAIQHYDSNGQLKAQQLSGDSLKWEAMSLYEEQLSLLGISIQRFNDGLCPEKKTPQIQVFDSTGVIQSSLLLTSLTDLAIVDWLPLPNSNEFILLVEGQLQRLIRITETGEVMWEKTLTGMDKTLESIQALDLKLDEQGQLNVLSPERILQYQLDGSFLRVIQPEAKTSKTEATLLHLQFAQTTSDGMITVGSVRKPNSTFKQSPILQRYSSTGQFIWELNPISAQNSTFTQAIGLADGGMFAVGLTTTDRLPQPILTQFSPSGEVVWFETFPERVSGIPTTLIQLSSGDVLIALDGWVTNEAEELVSSSVFLKISLNH